MPAGLWYVTLFSLGTGVSVIGFWVAVLMRGRLDTLLPGVKGARGHAMAELLTGGLLLGAGLALLADHKTGWTIALAGISLGALVYALANSPGMYAGQPAMRNAFLVGWLFTIPAIILLFVNVA